MLPNRGTITCQNCKESFTIDPEDFDFYAKISAPLPTFCWKCRFQRRAAFRNERHLYRGKSALTGKEVLTIYPPDSGAAVYDEPEWWSDDWDALTYGRDYDFSRPFFEQFHELTLAVPRASRNVSANVNSNYSGNASRLKNCYLIFNANDDEDCAYGNGVDGCKNSFDNSNVIKGERCYGSFWTVGCYQAHFSTRSMELASCWFCFGSKGLTNCFGCVNLKNKSYHIYNQPYSKEEYEKKIAEMRLDTWSGFVKARAEAMAFSQKFPHAYLNGIFNTDVTGEYVSESKNVHYGYLVRGGKDLKYVQYIQFLPPTIDSYDITVWGENNQLAYENMECGNGTYNVHFSLGCYNQVKNIEYSQYCMSSANLFGCVGLRKKEYCIFNKQYSKEAYEALRTRIIQHMQDMPYTDKAGRVYRYGEFFPMELSAVHYNRTLAIEHFPISREEAVKNNYRWYDAPEQEYRTTLKAAELPDAIGEVPDSIIDAILECMQCKKAYRIIPSELAFLRAERIPLPRLCIDCRHNERIAMRSKAVLYQRRCDCNRTTVYKNQVEHVHGSEPCPVEYQTAFPPDDPRVIYCLECFYAEID